MTPFEYVTIPVSIVLALGIGKLLSGVFAMFEHDKRDWIFVTWCITLLMLFLGQWLAIWRLRENESWSALEFMVVMLSPILYYAAAHILVTNQPESISSWSNHLAKIARPLIFIIMVAAANFSVRTYLILDTFNFSSFSLVLWGTSIAAIIWPVRWLLAIAALVWLIPVGILITTSADL